MSEHIDDATAAEVEAIIAAEPEPLDLERLAAKLGMTEGQVIDYRERGVIPSGYEGPPAQGRPAGPPASDDYWAVALSVLISFGVMLALAAYLWQTKGGGRP